MNCSASPNPMLPSETLYLSILSTVSISPEILHVVFVFDFFKAKILKIHKASRIRNYYKTCRRPL